MQYLMQYCTHANKTHPKLGRQEPDNPAGQSRCRCVGHYSSHMPRRVSASFHSREPASPPAPVVKRPPRRYRTGRNVQFIVKVSTGHGRRVLRHFRPRKLWVLGETLKHALPALQRWELGKGRGGRGPHPELASSPPRPGAGKLTPLYPTGHSVKSVEACMNAVLHAVLQSCRQGLFGARPPGVSRSRRSEPLPRCRRVQQAVCHDV
jgi:hypothetical protein